MTVGEYQQIKQQKGLNFFGEVINKFKDITGYQLVSATQHEIMNYFSEEINEKYKNKLLKVIKELKQEVKQI